MIWYKTTPTALKDEKWRPWYAWLPVHLCYYDRDGWAWLEWIERKMVMWYDGSTGYAYRVPERPRTTRDVL